MTHKDWKKIRWTIVLTFITACVYLLSTTVFKYSVGILEDIAEISNMRHRVIHLEKQVKKINKKLRIR